MTLLNEATAQKLTDVRVVERNVTRGILTQAQFDAELKKLPDDSENAEYISLDEFVEVDEDLDDSDDDLEA